MSHFTKFFLFPILIGIFLGKITGILNQPLLVQLLLTISDNILVLLKYITPFLIFSLTFSSLATMKENNKHKILFLCKLFVIVLLTLSILGLFVFLLSYILVPFLTFDFNTSNSVWLDPLFKIPTLKVFSSAYITLFSIILGILFGFIFNKNEIALNINSRLITFIYSIFQKVITPLMPIWIIGSFASTAYSNVGVKFILTDFLLSIYILILQFSWLFIMYFITSKIFKINFNKMYKFGLNIFGKIVSISGMGTQIIIPDIINKEKELGFDEKKSTFITATSFNMPGSLISNIVFVLGVVNLFDYDVSFSLLFSFVFLLILATVIAPSIPGGTAAITSSLCYSILGFSDEMVNIFYTLYYKQGISNSATNNASDLYISAFFKEKTKKQ